MEKLICPKCNESFPATTERGPGPAKAKFAAHVRKCEGKGPREGKEVEADFFVEDDPLKVGDQVMAGEPGDGSPVMTIEKIDDGVITCTWQEGGEIRREDFSLLDLFIRVPATLEEVAQECASAQQVEALEEAASALDEAEAAQPPNRKYKTTSESLKCMLTDDEIRDYAKKMAYANSEAARLEQEFSSIKSQYKGKIETQTAIRDDMARTIGQGFEFRQTECWEIWDWGNFTVTVVREDTFETVSRRTMTSSEM